LQGLDAQVLVPNRAHAERGIAAGARHLAFVLSVSEKHNMSNVRRSPAQSVNYYKEILSMLPLETRLRVNVATAFDCPFDGRVSQDLTLALLDKLIPLRSGVEICLCDTTGRATPDRVQALFDVTQKRYAGAVTWAYHGHDTYGLGVANVVAAIGSGVEVIDASLAGLGGCPFAPGATGNVATEDVVWTLAAMDIETNVDLSALLRVAQEGAGLPGACHGGRIRDVLLSRLSKDS
jgi:hydroxymethylglutaryl-CoA lyase